MEKVVTSTKEQQNFGPLFESGPRGETDHPIKEHETRTHKREKQTWVHGI
jgi:hypothetical protein